MYDNQAIGMGLEMTGRLMVENLHGQTNNYMMGNLGVGITTPAERIHSTGNIRADGIVFWGNSLSRTETRDNAGLQGDAGARSGFYETSTPGPASSWYPGANSWQHLIDVRHNNPGNNYAMQIAGSFFDQNFWVRKTNNNAAQAWRRLETSAEFPRVRFYPRNGSQEGTFRARIFNGVLEFENRNEANAFVWGDNNVLGLSGLTEAIITYSVTNDDTGGGCNRVSAHFNLGTISNNGVWLGGSTDLGCAGSDGNQMMIQIVFR
jgi:hypothetical protein